LGSEKQHGSRLPGISFLPPNPRPGTAEVGNLETPMGVDKGTMLSLDRISGKGQLRKIDNNCSISVKCHRRNCNSLSSLLAEAKWGAKTSNLTGQ